MKKKLAPLTLDELHSLYNDKRNALQSRLTDFNRVPQEDYFYELAYCLLTPQSSAFAADKAIKLLQQHDFRHCDIDPEPLLHQKDFYIRFHKTKAKHLLRMKSRSPEILAHLAGYLPDRQLREWLVQNVTGLGWKEASHFLRNIGGRNLAILDRHILKNMVRLGILKRLPKSLTPRRYKLLEEKFHTFAQQIGIPMDELDLLLWSMETGTIFK